MNNMQYSVKLDAFEGPLDLLLHLINRYEIDIYDIPVSQITEQYLLYLHTMKELQLDVASEFLVMAATLLAIKSKMLLPKKEEEVDMELPEDYEEDPREELVNRLIEYKKFKEAAIVLKEKEYERSQIFSKSPTNIDAYIDEKEEEREISVDITLYDMLGALQKLMKRKKAQQPVQTTVTRQEVSIEQKMNEIIQDLTNFNGRKSFFDLFEDADRGNIVVTFLAILELMKTKRVFVEQESNFENIFIQKIDKENQQ